MPASGVKKSEPDVAGDLDFLFENKKLNLNGRDLVFRELSVKESDACIDAARKPDGTFDGRINMRMIIAKSSVDPKISVDDIAKMPNRIYLRIAEFVNALNSIDDSEEPKEEGEGNE